MIPLVLVHGFMGGGAQWTGQKAALSQDYKVIALDLPGFGENAHLPVLDRIEGFADWAIAELHRLNLSRYHLLGHSMGGMVVQEMLRRDAQRIESLVLYSTGSVGILPGRFETISTSKARAAQEGATATARRISATWFLQRTAAEGYEACAQIAEKSSLAAIQAGLTAMEAWTGAAFLQEIDLRTLVLWGDQDRTYSWQQTHLLWSSISQAQLAVVPGCAHAVHLEKPDLFNSLLRDFLGNNASRGV